MPRRHDKQGAQGNDENLPDRPSNKYTISLRRSGPKVEIELLFESDYASMEFYDSLLQSVGSGVLKFELKLDQSRD
jgi:hypothetical protein